MEFEFTRYLTYLKGGRREGGKGGRRKVGREGRKRGRKEGPFSFVSKEPGDSSYLLLVVFLFL